MSSPPATLSLALEPDAVFQAGHHAVRVTPWSTTDTTGEELERRRLEGARRPSPAPVLLPGLLGILGALDALAVLAVGAVRGQRPVVDLVRYLAEQTSPPPGPFVRVVDTWWAVSQMWGPSPWERSVGEPSIAMPEDARWKDLQLGLETAPIEVGEVRLESLELLVHLPWSWFAAAGGGMAFIKSVEYWLHSPGRVRAESARLRAEEAEQLAREMEAQARQLRALEDIEELRMARTPALRDATLKLP